MSSRALRKQEARQARVAAEAADLGAQRRRRRITWLAAMLAAAVACVVAVIVLLGGGDDGTSPRTAAAPADAAPAGVFAGIPQRAESLGSASAPIVVDEFLDPQCPFCAQVTTTVIPPIVAKYVRSGDVRLRLRVLAFLGEDSVEAARFAAAAGLQNRLWDFMHAFMERQGQENSGYVDEVFLRDVSAAAGVDADRAFEEQTAARATTILEAADRLARTARVEGTPSFRVDLGRDVKLVSADQLESTLANALDGR